MTEHMNNTIVIIYQIFQNSHNTVFGNSLATIGQYDPHRGFSKIQQGIQFEELFPKYFFEGRDDDLLKLIKKTRASISNSSLQKSYKTYCNRFLDFLENILNDPKKFKNITKDIIAAYEIDGNQKLIKSLGGEDKFIEQAIADSYFFAPNVVNIRHDEICKAYHAHQPLPARWQSGSSPSKPKSHQSHLQFGYPNCQIDSDGNRYVRSVINRLTGYSISQGKTSIFKNYKISHIWSNAQHPLYFTNLWNIVIIPAWANDLMDKRTAISESLAAKMLNTFKAICEQYYKISSMCSNGNIGITPTYNANEVVHGSYNLNIIGGKRGRKPGIISTHTIKI